MCCASDRILLMKSRARMNKRKLQLKLFYVSQLKLTDRYMNLNSSVGFASQSKILASHSPVTFNNKYQSIQELQYYTL